MLLDRAPLRGPGAVYAHSRSELEANLVIQKYLVLTPSQQQDLLNFLRSR